MKGQLVLKANGETISVDGSLMLRGKIEVYEVVSSIARVLGVDTPEEWANCVLYCVARLPAEPDEMSRTIIPIPKKEN